MDALTENLTHRLDIEVWLKKFLILEAKFCFLLSPNYIFDSPPNDCYCFLIKLIPLSHKITAEIIIFIASIAAAFIETKQRFNIEQVGVKLGQAQPKLRLRFTSICQQPLSTYIIQTKSSWISEHELATAQSYLAHVILEIQLLILYLIENNFTTVQFAWQMTYSGINFTPQVQIGKDLIAQCNVDKDGR